MDDCVAGLPDCVSPDHNDPRSPPILNPSVVALNTHRLVFDTVQFGTSQAKLTRSLPSLCFHKPVRSWPCGCRHGIGVQFLADVNAAFMLSGQKWRGLETTLSRNITAAQLTRLTPTVKKNTSGAATILNFIVDGTDAVSFYVMRPKVFGGGPCRRRRDIL